MVDILPDVFIVWHLEHNDSQWTAEVSYSNLDTALPHSQLSTVTIAEAHVHWSTTATKVCSILTTERHVTTLYTLCTNHPLYSLVARPHQG